MIRLCKIYKENEFFDFFYAASNAIPGCSVSSEFKLIREEITYDKLLKFSKYEPKVNKFNYMVLRFKDEWKEHKRTRTFIGCSDSARLTLMYADDCGAPVISSLKFGEDGDYIACLINKNAATPDYYKLVHKTYKYLFILDDIGCTAALAGDFEIYRAGEFGCIIKDLSDKEWESDSGL